MIFLFRTSSLTVACWAWLIDCSALWRNNRMHHFLVVKDITLSQLQWMVPLVGCGGPSALRD